MMTIYLSCSNGDVARCEFKNIVIFNYAWLCLCEEENKTGRIFDITTQMHYDRIRMNRSENKNPMWVIDKHELGIVAYFIEFRPYKS